MHVVGAPVGQPMPDLIWQVYLDRLHERIIEAVEPARSSSAAPDCTADSDHANLFRLYPAGRDYDLDGLCDDVDPDDDNDGYPDNLDPAPLTPGQPGAVPALGLHIDLYG
jgi:hypothetical protein